MKRILPCLALLVLLTSSACADDNGVDSPRCDADELYDEVADTCVERPGSGDDAGIDDAGDSDDAGDTDDDDDADDGEDDPDGDDNAVDPECDQDEDGALSEACGGLDCDDNDPDRFPGNLERCDGKDNNCNGTVNSGLECSFYGHTESGLYSIDPFELTVNKEADLIDHTGEPIGLLDIDTHPDGVLYGMTRTELYAFYDAENYWIKVASISDVGDANGLAIDNGGTAYITTENYYFRIDLDEIEAQLDDHGFDHSKFYDFYYDPEQITITGGDYYSSGDCVVSGKNSFYMTSKHDPSEDYLVEIDRLSGQAQAVGPTGYQNVFGLTVGWGEFYGSTRDGELIAIDPDTGESELLETFSDKQWFGMASTPGR